MQYFLTALAGLAAGIIQGVTGFGAVIVLMLFLPMFYPLNISVGISGAIALANAASMTWTYRKSIDWKKVLLPALVNVLFCTLGTYASLNIDQRPIKKVFGAFLIVLAVYFLFFSKNKKLDLKLPVAFLLMVGAGLCEGFFGIGGPLMVIYFLSRTSGKEEYLASLSSYFMLTGIVNTGVRFVSGVLTAQLLPILMTGVLFILVGSFIAKKIVGKLDTDKVRTLTYIMIGVAGVVNLLR